MEHGHANHLADDWSSTAYWYQTLPSPQINIAPLNQRLPLRPTNQMKPSKELSEVLSGRGVNFEDFKRERDELYERWIEDAVAASLGNIQQAAEIRKRYLKN